MQNFDASQPVLAFSTGNSGHNCMRNMKRDIVFYIRMQDQSNAANTNILKFSSIQSSWKLLFLLESFSAHIQYGILNCIFRNFLFLKNASKQFLNKHMSELTKSSQIDQWLSTPGHKDCVQSTEA